jgi:hypothetical protein
VVLSVFGAVALFATGVGPRPAGSAWDLGYDLVLYKAVYLLGAAGCWWRGYAPTCGWTG